MNKPTYLFRIGSSFFSNSPTICEGAQVAKVIGAIGECYPTLLWYGADIDAKGVAAKVLRDAKPKMLGDSETVSRWASGFSQFLSGVFVGVPPFAKDPRFREGGLWTDDDEDDDLCDAVVEVRTLDTSYISVATSDRGIAESLVASGATAP